MLYASEWGKKLPKEKSNSSFKHIKKCSPMVWAEHCVECAAPLCYSQCVKYRKREDGRCRLFAHGVSIVPGNGLLGYSAMVSFEGWGKLEATYRPKQHALFWIRTLNFFAKAIFGAFLALSRLFQRKKDRYSFTEFGYKVREGLALLSNLTGKKPDAFYINVDTKETTTLIIETKTISRALLFKKSFNLIKGNNEIIIPFEQIEISDREKAFVSLYLQGDGELVFRALDFVTFSKDHKKRLAEELNAKARTREKKIKCVAWDLDNTLWNGVLIEQKVALNPEARELVLSLDAKGIVNSIISKNDSDEALKKLEEFGLRDFFVMPHINWLPKSANVADLAKRMNIGIDSICFVDDSLFELEEVHGAFPEVLCINAKEMGVINNLPCFDVPVTPDAKKRRSTYKMMEKEQAEFENWSGNIDDFLRQCRIKARIVRPSSDEIGRCHELMQRTNQLNASGRKLDIQDIEGILENEAFMPCVLKVSDKFGDYGITGFLIVDRHSQTITDFVISCRTANKGIEQSVIQTLARSFDNNQIQLLFRKTAKNGPLFQIIRSLDMRLLREDNDTQVFLYDGGSFGKTFDVVDVSFEYPSLS